MIKKARAIVLKTPPGKITDREFEKENGGNGLRYSSISSLATQPERGIWAWMR
jgi:hypothetical protein